MIHLDLFSGIGGFAYAIDQVFDNVEHIFCDNNKFCQEVLKKHWPNSKIYEDIRTITDTNWTGGGTSTSKINKNRKETSEKWEQSQSKSCGQIDILTGGFPCQPFSQAGRRKGTGDDRYLWPEMLRVIQLTNPTWIIAENVRGLLTIEQGLVFEQVCLDLEASGYEVQPLIIPAVAVNAPHRRDRVWFIAHKINKGLQGSSDKAEGHIGQCSGEWSNETQNNNVENSECKRGRGRVESGRQILERQSSKTENARPSWEKNWIEVAACLCRVDDGVPRRVDRLKSLGNAIVPQVAIEILKGIKE